MLLKAVSVAKEFNMSSLTALCGISRKFAWDESLMLEGELLGKVLGTQLAGDQKIIVFSFGTVVFYNATVPVYDAVVKLLRSVAPTSGEGGTDDYQEEYSLEVARGDVWTFADKVAQVPGDDLFYPELVATVLAKSVALERVEHNLQDLLDRTESLLIRFERGKVHLGDRELARTAARIFRHEYDSINYIMILDNPQVTWTSATALSFYGEFADFFELRSRYQNIKSKAEVLSNVISGFASISHSLRATILEAIVAILIVAELVLMIAELFK